MTKLETKKDEYLAKIIHDLKTPTFAQIKALESFLTTGSNKISPEEKDLIELTLNSCNYTQKLIEIFSQVHKLNYNKIILNYEKFSINTLIKNSINELKILLKYNFLDICFKEEKEIIITADKLQIKRVIENLLSNAINYAFENSTIEIELKEQNRTCIFEIKNKSQYIEPKIMKEIFEKYKTHDSCYNKAGVGLGLYLSKEIINTHFGKMIAKSTQDDVNIFGFELPIE